jgi:hypothetical protein
MYVSLHNLLLASIDYGGCAEGGRVGYDRPYGGGVIFAVGPVAMLEVPAHRVPQTLIEAVCLRIVEISPEFRAVDRVSMMAARYLSSMI